MATFNGWNIIALPAYPPAPKSIEWQLDDVVGATRNPFTQQQQAYDWGQAVLRGSLSYPFMPATIARTWMAALMAFRGVLNVFQIGDPLNSSPQDPGASGGTVTGSGQTGFTLVTSSSGLQAGDWFQIGYRLYMVTGASGGTLTIWPPLRESPAGGAALVIDNPKGLFRLAGNSRKIVTDDQRFASITFEIEEAL